MMQIGSYQLGEEIDRNPVCSRFRGKDASNGAVEIRLLHRESRIDLDIAAQHLKRASLVYHPFVQKIVAFDFQTTVPYIVLAPAYEEFLNPQEFIRGGTDAWCTLASRLLEGVLATHRLGVVIGPFDYRLISVNPQLVPRIDISGTSSHLLFSTKADLREFPFAAPETISSGISDVVTDYFSLGRFLSDLLAPFPTNDRPLLSFQEELASLLETDASVRGTLEPLYNKLLDQLRQSQSTSPTMALADASPIADATMNIEQSLSFAEPLPSSSSEGIRPSQQLGRFKIESKLGEGGMGAVYRGRDESDGTPVAIKVLSEHLLNNQRAKLRFTKEARLLARANNPYIANLLESNSEGPITYLAVEFVPGGSLGNALRKGEMLDLSFALALICDAVRGLAIAHDRGIVHRDIKPDNILLTEHAREVLDGLRASPKPAPPEIRAGDILAKVADFGIARTEHQSESLAMTREGSILGTPLYMAPEQGLGADVDSRADVYSIGVTFFQLLIGRPPFEADSNIALMTLHANEPPPPIKQLRSDVPDALALVIEKCLAKNPDARYSNARDLLIDLENIQRGQPTSIGMHPPILSTSGDDVLRFEHAWDLEATPEQLWPYVSHTDRVNHAIGLSSVEYTVEKDPIHGPQRFAETSVAGQKIRWQEHPYEWVEGRRLSVLREFTHGPFSWFVNVVELHPQPNARTRLVQRFFVLPKGWVGATLAKIQLGKKSKRSFGTVYAQIEKYLKQSANSIENDPWGKTVELPAARLALLRQRMARVANRGVAPDVIDALTGLLQFGSDLEVARIRPLAFAERTGLPPQAVLEACLYAAHEGLLDLMWDILCPSCRIPSEVQSTLANVKDHAHCEACDVRFELDFAKSVELVFRAHPEIRTVETKTYCIGGPAWSQHVVAQVRLAAGERFDCEMGLTDGAYIVRGPQLSFTVPLRITPVGIETRSEILLSRAPVEKLPLELRNGRQTISLFNDSARDLQVRIERTASKHDAVTAAQASSLAVFRELFGGQVLSSGQMISVAHITVALIRVSGAGELYRSLGDAQAFSQIRKQLEHIATTVRNHSGATIKTIGETVVAIFSEAVTAVRCGMELVEDASSSTLPVACVVHSGPAMVTTLDDRLDYFGQMIHESLSLLEVAREGELLTTDTIASTQGVGEILQSSIFQVRNEPRMSVAASPLVAVRRGSN